MDWSEGEWDSIVDSLFPLSMFAKLISHYWMDHLLEMQNVLSPLGSLHSCLVLCPFISDHACPDHCVDLLPVVSIGTSEAVVDPQDAMWCGYDLPHQSRPGHFWATLLDLKEVFKPCHYVLYQFIIGHTICFPSLVLLVPALFELRKVLWNVTTIWESLTNFSSCLQGVFQLLT